MQFRKFFLFLGFCTFYLIFSPSLNAQKISQNNRGEKIVVFQNGNWELYDDSKPLHRAVLREHLEKAGFENQTMKGDEKYEEYEYQLEIAEEELALAEENESDAKFSKILLEEELEELKDEGGTKLEIKIVREQLRKATALEKRAKFSVKHANKKLKALKKSQGKLVSKPKKRIRIKKKVEEEEIASEEDSYTIKDGSFYAASKSFKKYKIENDVIYSPPKTECNLIFEGMDEFIGKKRKDVERQVLFTYTEESARRFMKEEDYIFCEGNLTQIHGGVLFLNLFISIKTSDAKRSFGELGKGGKITIKMIDGSKVVLKNNQSDDGVFNTLNNRHTYTAQYRINSGQEKKLRKGEVDLIRIVWGTGYEDYEVYNLDFFADQFRCLND